MNAQVARENSKRSIYILHPPPKNKKKRLERTHTHKATRLLFVLIVIIYANNLPHECGLLEETTHVFPRRYQDEQALTKIRTL